MLYAMFYLRENCYLNVFVMKEYEDRDGNNKFTVRIEQKDNIIHFCEWILPDKVCIKSFGFTKVDLFHIKDYLSKNEEIIIDDWKEYHSHKG